MSDSVKTSAARPWLRFLLVFSVILLLLLVFLLTCTDALDGVKRFFRYGGRAQSFTFSVCGDADYALFDGCLAMTTPNGATVFDTDGAVRAQLSAGLSCPALQIAEERLLLYDIGGTYASVLNTDGVAVHTQSTDGAIYDASLSESGSCAVLRNGNDSRAILEIYDESGVLRYRRSSKTRYLNACALSPNGQLAAVAALEHEALEFRSAVQLLSTDREELAAHSVLGGELVRDLAFLSDDVLCAVGEQTLYFLGADGTLRGAYTDEDGTLSDYRFAGGRAYAVYRLGADAYRLVALDENGSVISSVAVSGTVLHLSACANYIAVLTDRTLSLFDDSPTLRSQTENVGFTHAFVRDDGTVLCVADGRAELYIP